MLPEDNTNFLSTPFDPLRKIMQFKQLWVNAEYLAKDLTLAGAVGGLNRLFYAPLQLETGFIL